MKASQQKIFIPEHMRPNFKGYEGSNDLVNSINLLEVHLRRINYLLNLHFNAQLSVRELQTLSLLLKGRTAIETARALNLSPKTIESYINSIKVKFKCLSKAALFDKILERNLINIIIKI